MSEALTEATLRYCREVGCPLCGHQWTRAEKAAVDLGHVTVYRDHVLYQVRYECPEGEFHRCTDEQAARFGGVRR